MATNNATSAKPSGSTPSCNAQNTNMHKLMKMGQSPKFGASGGKKTPA
jgi:hypothetical protein